MSGNVYVLLRRYYYEGDQLIGVAKDLRTAKRMGKQLRGGNDTSAKDWVRDLSNSWDLECGPYESIVIMREEVQ